MARILDFSPGKVVRFHEADGQFAVQTVKDVSAVIALNKKREQAGIEKTEGGDHFLAEFDGEVLAAWAARNGTSFGEVMNDDRLMRRFLNDPENAAFRVKKGRV